MEHDNLLEFVGDLGDSQSNCAARRPDEEIAFYRSRSTLSPPWRRHPLELGVTDHQFQLLAENSAGSVGLSINMSIAAF